MNRKVLKVDMINGTATVSNELEETLEDYPLSAFNYTPNVGDFVKVYKNSNSVMIVLDAPNQQNYAENVYENQEIVVNKVGYALLAFFFGGLGVHHFYAGDSRRGVKYLLLSILLSWTVVVPLVIEIKSIIQGINVLTMPGDMNGNVILPRVK